VVTYCRRAGQYDQSEADPMRLAPGLLDIERIELFREELLRPAKGEMRSLAERINTCANYR
jgi:hypothetical protein